MSSYGKNPKSQFLRTSSVNDSVAKNNDSVNKKSIKEDNQRNVLSEQQHNIVKVASAYKKDNPQKMINNSNILWICPDKK